MNSIFRVRFALYLVAVLACGLLLYLVAPILSPLLFAAILAYICLPLVDRLAKRLPRWLAGFIVLVLLVFGRLFGFFSVLLALAASATLLVGLRHLRAQFLAKDLYQS